MGTVNGLNCMYSVWYWFTENNYPVRIRTIRFPYPSVLMQWPLTQLLIVHRSPFTNYHPCELLIIVTHPKYHFPIFWSHFVMQNSSIFVWTHLNVIVRSFIHIHQIIKFNFTKLLFQFVEILFLLYVNYNRRSLMLCIFPVWCDQISIQHTSYICYIHIENPCRSNSNENY